MTTFEQLIAPLKTFLSTKGHIFDEKSNSRTFFFKDFVLTLIYSVTMQIASLRMLVSDLETNTAAHKLGLKPIAYSTLRDGFSRFCSSDFKSLYSEVLQSHDWLPIEAMDEIGIVQLVDGSVFPTLESMTWASYKRKKKAIRLHLSWELNRQIPTEFIAQKANSSERKFLLSILKTGVTYIADRGYFSFKLAEKIEKTEAFFILRIKRNMIYSTIKVLPITANKAMPECFKELSDEQIQFDNDDSGLNYRLVRFRVFQSEFLICTNRLDLSTLQIIMLYAYRWQVELMFKFLKRTMGGIHLLSHSENGVNIQFYILMTTILLEMRLKQICTKKAKVEHSTSTVYQDSGKTGLDKESSEVEAKPKSQLFEANQTCSEKPELSPDLEEIRQKPQKLEDLNTYFGDSPDIWIQSIADYFYKYWKIGAHWLLHLKNLINQEFDYQVINILASP